MKRKTKIYLFVSVLFILILSIVIYPIALKYYHLYVLNRWTCEMKEKGSGICGEDSEILWWLHDKEYWGEIQNIAVSEYYMDSTRETAIYILSSKKIEGENRDVLNKILSSNNVQLKIYVLFWLGKFKYDLSEVVCKIYSLTYSSEKPDIIKRGLFYLWRMTTLDKPFLFEDETKSIEEVKIKKFHSEKDYFFSNWGYWYWDNDENKVVLDSKAKTDNKAIKPFKY